MIRKIALVATAGMALSACGGSDPDAEACESVTGPWVEWSDGLMEWDESGSEEPYANAGDLDTFPDLLQDAAAQAESPQLRDRMEEIAGIDTGEQDFFLGMNMLVEYCEG